MRVSKTEWRSDEVDPLHTERQWETLYETEPCISFTGDSLQVFQLMMSGGRMQLLNDDELLLTVGDHAFDRDVYGTVFAQDSEASYGKTLRIHIDDGTAETFTMGHRNPQGLHVAADGRIWSTEHGPRGGDELNLLEEGKNYGWPYVTYGTDYHKHVWLENAQAVRPADLQLPVYSWVPSIGVSNVIESNSALFPSWKGDLIVASLRGKSLFRIQVEGERAVVAEPMPMGGRIRDLIEDSAGRLILWTDAGSFLMMEPMEEESRDGSALFAAYCAACHEVDNDGQHALGPDLGGVFGRAIGSAPDYQYSSVFKTLSGEWNEESLGRFLAEPRAFAPGTTMEFAGISDEDELERLIDYLESLD
jgi:cytochrome c2